MLVMKLFKVNIVLTIQGNGFDIDKKSQFETGFFYFGKEIEMVEMVFKRSRSPSREEK